MFNGGEWEFYLQDGYQYSNISNITNITNIILTVSAMVYNFLRIKYVILLRFRCLRQRGLRAKRWINLVSRQGVSQMHKMLLVWIWYLQQIPFFDCLGNYAISSIAITLSISVCVCLLLSLSQLSLSQRKLKF